MNNEHKDMQQNTESDTDSFEVDPWAEHEEQPSSTLSWPDRKPEASKQPSDDVAQDSGAGEHDLSIIDSDVSEFASGNFSIPNTYQEYGGTDNDEQPNWRSDHDSDSE